MSEGGGMSAPEVSGEVARRLRAVEHRVSPGEVGEVWVFPPLGEEGSAEFLLFTRLMEEGRRQLFSSRIRYGPGDEGADGAGASDGGAAHENGNGRRGGQEVMMHGSVPADRVPRLVERLRRRLDDGREPLHLVIDGEEGRWRSLFGHLENGGAAGNGHPENGRPEVEPAGAGP